VLVKMMVGVLGVEMEHALVGMLGVKLGVEKVNE